MKYVKPEVTIILFDNSDIITASNFDLPCTSIDNGKAYCAHDGNSEGHNDCANLGHECTGPNQHGKPCNASGNQIFFNAVLDDPIVFDDEEEDW